MAYLVKPLRSEELAPAVELAIARFAELAQAGRETATLRQALEDRKTIERAKGLLMDRLGLTEAAAFDVQLVLSGHTHGGQVLLPGVGAIAGRKFPVLAGTGREGNATLFVSRGVGTVYVPVRINCPPEVVLLTLQCAA
jgi:hypothetical protein